MIEESISGLDKDILNFSGIKHFDRSNPLLYDILVDLFRNTRRCMKLKRIDLIQEYPDFLKFLESKFGIREEYRYIGMSPDNSSLNKVLFYYILLECIIDNPKQFPVSEKLRNILFESYKIYDEIYPRKIIEKMLNERKEREKPKQKSLFE